MTGNTPMEQSESVLENQTYGPFVPPKLQKLVEEQFRESGFFSDKGRLAPEILKFQPMTGNAIRKLILQDTRTPRLRPIADALPDRGKTPSALEVALADLFKISYVDFDPQILKQRQQYWQNISGTNEEKQNQMLMQDPIMQAVALDRLIYNGVNTLLREGSEKSPAMQKLVQQMTLRDDLLAIMRAGTIRRDQL